MQDHITHIDYAAAFNGQARAIIDIIGFAAITAQGFQRH